jgi:RNA polymerase sigma-70 factor (ECF subfamily)
METGRDDFDLVERALSGDEGAVSAMVARYQNMVFHISLAVLGDYHLAEDSTQEAFIKAFAGLRSLKKKSRFSRWLYRLAYNNAVNKLRSTRREPAHMDGTANGLPLEQRAAAPGPDPSEAAETKSRKEVIDETIAGLPEMYRLSVMLFYREGLSVKEIAEVLGVPVGTVKIRLLRARNILKERLRRFLR